MDVRRELDEEYESMSEEIKPFREMFLGSIVGVLLTERGASDPHVCFQLIHEDDGHWFLSTNSASIFWVDDYINVLTEVKKWCEENCEADIHNGIQYGWKFKEGK